MYEVLLSHEARKQYKKFDSATKRKVNKCIDSITADPYTGLSIRKLHGILKGKYRCRSGGLRVVYSVSLKKKQVLVLSIKPRGDVYKQN